MAYTRVNWQDSPSTATPISASNLNKMDKGIKDLEDSLATVATTGDYDDLTDTPNLSTVATSGDYDDLTNKPQDHLVNVSNEVDEDYRVNFLYSKNLFDKSKTKYGMAWNNSANANLAICYVACKPNTPYSIKYTGTSGISLTWLEKTSASATSYTKLQALSGATSITTQATSGVITIQFDKSNISESDLANVNIMLVEGNTIEDYEPYITPSIVVDNEEIFPQPIQEIDISSYKNTSIVSSVDTSKVYKIGNIYFFNITLTINQSGEWKPIFANLPFTPSDTYNLMGINENNEGIRAAINAQGNIIIRNVPRANVRYYITGTLIF